nr:RNA-directed DNA polymerase, eukaryota, reverse transcriptase zinc-binding domain protein [Tanacetum cinerariifolium]
MGSYGSKEDDVNRISTSIFVTNFPESFSAKDFFQSCKQYGHVVDSFIPLKRSKEGKRFGFVRFINVFSVERLKNVESFRGGDQTSRKDVGGADSGISFFNVVKSIYKSGTVDCEANPAIVLDDDCLNSKDLTNSLLGRVKEFASLTNLKIVLTNEGFVDISVRYMGELWVLLEFASTKSKELLSDTVGVGTWFSELKQASFDFDLDGRVVWVEEESCFHSKRLCLYTKFHMNIFENFKMIFRGKVQYAGSNGDNSEVAKVPETNFDESIGPKVNLSDDLFGIHPLLNKNSKENKENANENDQSLNYPPGFTPNAEENDRNVNGDKSQKCNTKEVFAGRDGDKTKMENMELRCVRSCWGNYAFDYIHSNSIDLRDKRMLWDYLVHTINKWDGEVVIMGDFNEVRYKYDRFGLIFNGQGADEFNSFIANEGLVEVPLGEIAFTWCHKSATKMSKLDRHSRTGMKEKYKEELQTLDDDIDNGNGSDTVVHKRMEVINALQRIDKLNAMEIAQKTKIKWSVEGDENSRFFHTMLNKKRNQLNIQGVMVDGVWNEKPHDVKREFFQHFSNRFDKPMEHRAVVDMCYPRSLLIDQQKDLKRMVTKEGVKRAVWDRGTNKSSGPDGFTFGFYRQFWLTIENDVFEAVSHFFIHANIPKGCNSSFITLIPKIPDANNVNDFRPISLIGSIYKIIAKSLANRLVRRVVDAGLFMGIKLSHLVNLSHMFYADDAVFVGQWSDNNINTLIHVLDCFYRASGLRMNMSKSKIMGVHVEGGMVKHAASKLGCLTLNTPFYYLGSKVGGSMSLVQAWKEVIDKVKSRLSNWKMKALSIGGWLTLLNRFFNGHEVGSNKATWVKWNSVLTAKDSWGLGVSSLYALNRGLRMKWVWRFYNQKTSLWANVIKAIHGEDGSMGKAKYAGVRTCWTTIVNEIRILSDQGVNVLEFMRLKSGNGDMDSFWNDNWFGGGVLKYLYPRLYALENGKSVNVCTKLSDPSMDYSFRRKTRGGAEQEQLDALMDLVSMVNLVSMGDRWVWTLERSGEFSMASLRKMDVLPTRLNISRRGIDIHSISCPICDCGVESSEHLLFRCNLTRRIARKISLWWNVNYEDVNSYDEWSTWMVSLRLAAKAKLMFEGLDVKPRLVGTSGSKTHFLFCCKSSSLLVFH